MGVPNAYAVQILYTLAQIGIESVIEAPSCRGHWQENLTWNSVKGEGFVEHVLFFVFDDTAAVHLPCRVQKLRMTKFCCHKAQLVTARSLGTNLLRSTFEWSRQPGSATTREAEAGRIGDFD